MFLLHVFWNRVHSRSTSSLAVPPTCLLLSVHGWREVLLNVACNPKGTAAGGFPLCLVFSLPLLDLRFGVSQERAWSEWRGTWGFGAVTFFPVDSEGLQYSNNLYGQLGVSWLNTDHVSRDRSFFGGDLPTFPGKDFVFMNYWGSCAYQGVQ